MAINYASKCVGYVDERFVNRSFTNILASNDFDWAGVESITIYQVPTVALNDYTLSGTSRYGTPAELQNRKQDMKLTQDKAFTFTIDKKSEQDVMGVMEAGKALAREVDEVIIPTVDKYRIAKVVAGASNTHTMTSALSASNAYAEFLHCTEILDELGVPQIGRVAYVTPRFYNFIKQDEAFIKKGDMSQQMVQNGVMGEIDGVTIIKVPSAYMPSTKTNFFITLAGIHPMPVKLETYKVHEDAPGINGSLVEGRIRHDAFVLQNKKDAIVVSVDASSVTVTLPTSNATPQNATLLEDE